MSSNKEDEKVITLKDSGERKEYGGGALKDPSSRRNKGRYDLIPPGSLRRLAIHYARGAEKYDDRNWEKGIPYDVCIDSCLRHINQHREGSRAEDHIAAAAWWLFAIMHFEETGYYDIEPVVEQLPKELTQVCKICGKNIEPGQIAGIDAVTKEVFHMECLVIIGGKL